MQQQVMVMQQKSQLMTDQLSSMPKDTAGEVAAYNSQAEALSRVNTELNSMNKTLRLREGWEGLKQGLQEYADMASNIGQQISDAVKGAFQGLEDAIVNFVKTGKLNFKDLADSIITDLIRIAVRSAIIKPLAEAAGSLFSGFFAKGGAFDGGVQKFATGGIVMSPTLFGMAGGAGLMGEAGPEAIMPLARTSSGHLGVRTAGGGQQAMSVQVNVINQSSQNVSAKSGPMQFDGKSFVINTILQDVQNNGPLRGLMAGGGAY
jgi:lambda family phage tail tape measure protein